MRNLFYFILPPFILLPLAMVPPDLGTSLLWMLGGIAVFISVVNIARLIFFRIYKNRYLYPEVVRPILTISIYCFCIISIKNSLMLARESTNVIANEIFHFCRIDICPTTLKGFEIEKNKSHAPHKKVGGLAKYPVYYKPNDSLTSFELHLYVNFDASYIYKPDGAGKIVEFYQCC